MSSAFSSLESSEKEASLFGELSGCQKAHGEDRERRHCGKVSYPLSKLETFFSTRSNACCCFTSSDDFSNGSDASKWMKK